MVTCFSRHFSHLYTFLCMQFKYLITMWDICTCTLKNKLKKCNYFSLSIKKSSSHKCRATYDFWMLCEISSVLFAVCRVVDHGWGGHRCAGDPGRYDCKGQRDSHLCTVTVRQWSFEQIHSFLLHTVPLNYHLSIIC